MPACKQCSANFEIRPQDKTFYHARNVPEPTLCPRCRDRRRWAFANDRTLYSRTCDLCKKPVISIYPSQTPYTVYCTQCWYGDSWSPTAFAQEMDFSRPFFPQFAELQKKVPRIALSVFNCETSPYVNNCGGMDKCYLCAASGYSTECFHQLWAERNRNCSDGYKTQDNELCYEIVDTFRSYHSGWLLRCEQMMESYFCVDCKNCTKCVFSSNLNGKTLHIFNKPVTDVEYKAFVQGLKSYTQVLKNIETWHATIAGGLHRYATLVNCQDATGDNLRSALQSHNVFDCEQINNVHYSSNMFQATDCMDISSYGDKCEFCYEAFGIGGGVSNVMFSLQSTSSGLLYCDFCSNVIDGFGCVGMRKKANCILNKEYSKEEYSALKEKLINHMKQTGEWGEFFPPALSPFGYNETSAMTYYPLTKDEAVKLGFNWCDTMPGTFGKETLKPSAIPDMIEEVADDITKQVLACVTCGKNYKIIAQELAFYKTVGIALPRKCPDCRLKDRLSLRNAMQLRNGSCGCTLSQHGHTGVCGKQFATAHPEGISYPLYCDECYRKETF